MKRKPDMLFTLLGVFVIGLAISGMTTLNQKESVNQMRSLSGQASVMMPGPLNSEVSR